MGLRVVNLALLLSIISGCASKPSEPTKPGISEQLRFPVVLIGQGRVVTKDTELDLTTTTVASGLNFPEFILLDTGGAKYSVTKVTDFDRTSTFLDMGTTPYRVFLQLKSEGTASLADAKELVTGGRSVPVIASARSMADLVELCRKSWAWQ